MIGEREVVTRIEGVTIRRLRAWVRRGWVIPASGDGGGFYSDTDLARIRLICQLRNQFGVNEESISLILSLMDQLYGVRHDVRALARAIKRQPGRVQNDILEEFRKRRE